MRTKYLAGYMLSLAAASALIAVTGAVEMAWPDSYLASVALACFCRWPSEPLQSRPVSEKRSHTLPAPPSALYR
jgi:hypothetical protein